MSQVPPKHKHREETEMLIFKGTLRPKFNLYVLCYKFILCLYGKIWLLDIHTKECVYTSLHDKCKGNIWCI